MSTVKESVLKTPGFKATIGIAGLIGLVGGFLFGIWDSVTVIQNHTSPWTVYTLPEMLSLSLYSAAIFALIGCLVMIAIGVVSAGIIRIGRYSVNKAQLAGVFICVSVLLMVSAIITVPSVTGDIFDVIEVMVICTLSGLGLASLSIYALNKRMRKEKLIALSISSLVSIVVLLLVGLWINFGQLHDKALSDTVPVLADIIFLLIMSIFGVGLYKLVVWILKRYHTRRIREVGWTLLAFMLAAFVAISFTGPYGFDNEAVASPGSENGSEGMPNILWIVMDTVRADSLSCYGYHHNTTPNIDKIADEGILYENAISTSPWTTPSHASMFTGMFPSKHGVDAEHSWLDGRFETIAEVLSANGYKTFEYTNNQYIGPITGMQQGFDTFVLTPYGEIRPSGLPDYLMIGRFKLYIENVMLRMDDGAQKTNEVVMKWIADAHQAEAPFFVFINYMEAHSPYHPPEEYAVPYLSEGVSFAEASEIRYEQTGCHITGMCQRSAQDFENLRARYDGEISYLDFRIGQLLDNLRDLEILDNTLLIITSDHGENFGEHRLTGHILCVYDTLIHVPLIIRYPGLAEPGLRVDGLVQLTDLFPTILDIVGINWSGEAELQGHSLVKDVEQPGSEFAISEYAMHFQALNILNGTGFWTDLNKYSRRLKTIRNEEFKYIWASDGRDELYNIREDAWEMNNLIEVEPEKAAELKALLKEWLNSFETYRPGDAKQIQ